MSESPQGPWPPPPNSPQPPYGPAPQGQPPYGQPYYGPYGQQPYGAHPGGPFPPAPQKKKRTGLIVGLIAGAVVLVVCVVVTAVLVTRDDGGGTSPRLPAGVAASADGDGSITMAEPGVNSPVVDVYEDFQCPVCKSFYQVNDSTLKTLAAQSKAKVVYHPIVIFSEEPQQGNSLRAASAAHCVTDGAHWMAFQEQVFAHQPAEGSEGFSADDLVSYGSAAGITGSAFASCVRSQRYASDVRQASKTAISGGLQGTPTVKVNGRTLGTDETLTADGLRNAVDAAA